LGEDADIRQARGSQQSEEDEKDLGACVRVPLQFVATLERQNRGDLRMAEKTIVERAAEKVGYGIAMAEDVAGSVRTAVGTAMTMVSKALTPAKKTVAKSTAKKAPAKKGAKKTAGKKSSANKPAAKKAAKKSVKKPAISAGHSLRSDGPQRAWEERRAAASCEKSGFRIALMLRGVNQELHPQLLYSKRERCN
jgi:hypothetical protein